MSMLTKLYSLGVLLIDISNIDCSSEPHFTWCPTIVTFTRSMMHIISYHNMVPTPFSYFNLSTLSSLESVMINSGGESVTLSSGIITLKT